MPLGYLDPATISQQPYYAPTASGQAALGSWFSKAAKTGILSKVASFIPVVGPAVGIALDVVGGVNNAGSKSRVQNLLPPPPAPAAAAPRIQAPPQPAGIQPWMLVAGAMGMFLILDRRR